jgi:hypothetical protein
MNQQMNEVMRRRGELQARIAAQRGQVAEIATRLQPALSLADQGLSAIRFLRSHPVLTGGVLALLAIRRRGVAGLVKGVWRAWKGYRYFTAVSEKLGARF